MEERVYSCRDKIRVRCNIRGIGGVFTQYGKVGRDPASGLRAGVLP